MIFTNMYTIFHDSNLPKWDRAAQDLLAGILVNPSMKNVGKHENAGKRGCEKSSEQAAGAYATHAPW